MQDPRNISIKDYTYELPEERIARYPLAERDSSKLLLWRDGHITDKNFRALTEHLPPNSALVFNHSSVIKARLLFKSVTGAVIEIFCLEPEHGNEQGLFSKSGVLWKCMVGRLKKWKEETLLCGKENIELQARILRKEQDHVLIKFSWQPVELTFSEVLQRLGVLPIPPYLNRPTETIDQTRYQTVYAKDEGSVAAPTAGLHFTPQVLEAVKKKDIPVFELSLHVGSGTFKPVKADLLKDHPMHAEWMSIDIHTVEQLQQAGNRALIAVGTTSLRALESLYWLGCKIAAGAVDEQQPEVGQWEPYAGEHAVISAAEALSAISKYMNGKGLQRLVCRTSILIAPPYKLKMARGLITNFHQPQSTLLLLVAAIAGDGWRKIYEHALENNYRFLSYGDSSLLLPSAHENTC